MIRTTCPQCGREDAIADYLASLPVMCKSCGHKVTMGGPIEPPKPVLTPLAPPPPPPSLEPDVPPEPVELLVPPPPEPDEPVAELRPAASENHVLTPRPAFAKAPPPGTVDLFEDVPLVEARTERPPLPPMPNPPPAAAGPHRGRRLMARLITLIGAALAVVAGLFLVKFAPSTIKQNQVLARVFLFVPLGLYALYNLALLGTQGQDFGKRALKLKIVGDDGTPARFGRAFLKRELVVVLLLLGVVPLAWKLYGLQADGQLRGAWQRAGGRMLMPELMPAAAAVLFSVLNVLLIFGKDGKCIHDKLARTTVTRDRPKPPTPAARPQPAGRTASARAPARPPR